MPISLKEYPLVVDTNKMNESISNDSLPIYQNILNQPLAPILLRLGLINLTDSQLTRAPLNQTITHSIDDLASIVSELSSKPVAKQIYNHDKPIVRLVTNEVSLQYKNSLTDTHYFRLIRGADGHAVNTPVVGQHEVDVRLEIETTVLNDGKETIDTEVGVTDGSLEFINQQILTHSDVVLIFTDDTTSQSMLNLLVANSGGNSPALMIQIDCGNKPLSLANNNLLKSTSAKINDCISEILLFDSLLDPDNTDDPKLKPNTLKRISDFAAEDALEFVQQSPDFDYLGPISNKKSLLSWRNIFGRFINFLSPAKKQPQAVKLQPGKQDNLAEMNQSKTCHHLYALFMRADQLAIRYANAHRSSFILIYCLGAFALINAALAIGFSEIGWLALSSALAEFIALIAIFFIYRNDHKKHYHIKWLEYRSLAEILRLSPHLNSMGMSFSTEGLERHKLSQQDSIASAHSVGRTWLVIYSETIKRWLSTSEIKIEQQSLKQAKCFLTDKLLAGQINYHFKNSHKMHIAGHSLGHFSFVLFVLAFLFVSGKLLTKALAATSVNLDPEMLHHIGHYLGFLAAVCPMLGSAAFAIRNHAEFDISSQRSQTMLKKLTLQMESFNQLDIPICYTELQQNCQSMALSMQSETADWLEIYEVKETEPG
jgi:hypothetical protein